MMGQQLRTALGNLRKSTFESIGNTGMQRTPRRAQQRAIGCVLHQRMLEQVARMRGYALAKQQTGLNKAIKRCMEVCFRLADDRSQNSMGKLPSDCRADLRYLPGLAEPVEARHQRGVQACRDCQTRRGDSTFRLQYR